MNFSELKIIWGNIKTKPSFFYDKEKFYIDDSCFMMKGESLSYYNAILNSNLLFFAFKTSMRGVGDKGIQYKKEYLQYLPIVPADNYYIQEISDYSNQLHTLHSKTKLQQENLQQLQNQISILENKINQIAYSLYHLTNEEINYIAKLTGDTNVK